MATVNVLTKQRQPLSPISVRTKCLSNNGNILYCCHKLPFFQNEGLEQFLTNDADEFKEYEHPIGFLRYASNRLSSNVTVNYIIYKDGIWNLRNSVKIKWHYDGRIKFTNSWSMTIHCKVNNPIVSSSINENNHFVTVHQTKEECIWNRNNFMPDDSSIITNVF